MISLVNGLYCQWTISQWTIFISTLSLLYHSASFISIRVPVPFISLSLYFLPRVIHFLEDLRRSLLVSKCWSKTFTVLWLFSIFFSQVKRIYALCVLLIVSKCTDLKMPCWLLSICRNNYTHVTLLKYADRNVEDVHSITVSTQLVMSKCHKYKRG